MQTRQMDASAAARRHRRPRLQPASPAAETSNGPAADTSNGPGAGTVPPAVPPTVRAPAAKTSNGPGAGIVPPPVPPAPPTVRTPAAPVRRSRPAPPSRVAAFGARLAWAPRLVPPVTVPIASCAPSHATSGGS
jgi:hypothetical protein